MAKAKAAEAVAIDLDLGEVVVHAPEEEVVEQFPATPGDTHTFVTDLGVADPNKPRDEQ